MFSMMDPFAQRPNHNNTIPCFIHLGSQPNSCHAGRRPFHFGNGHARNWCGAPDFEQGGFMNSPFANVFQRVFEERCGGASREENKRKEKSDETADKETASQRKRKSESPGKARNDQSKLQKGMDSSPTAQDVMNHAMSFINGFQDERDSKWQEQIDCRGFDSKNIKVKIGSDELLLKAFKKTESGNGVQTISMRRSVPFPENIDKKRIKCKLSSNGILIIEAPYLDNDKNSNALEFVCDFMAAMLPGLEGLMRPNNSSTESQEKESQSEKCTDKNEEISTETNEKEKENHTTNESNRRDGDKFSEQKLEASNMKDDTSQTNHHDLEKMEKEPPVSSVDDKVEIEGNDEAKWTEDGDCDAVSKHGLHRDETDSTTSENSFVLLSELENEESRVDAEADYHKSSNDGCENVAASKDSENTEEEEVTNDGKDDEASLPSTQNGNENNASTECGQQNDDKDKVLFRLEMPSYNPDSMKVTFDNTKRLLTISASKDQTSSGSGTPPITKTVAVDDDVDVAGLQCYFKDGTLTVTAPMKPTVVSIPIKA